jgi:hypothetical protein
MWYFLFFILFYNILYYLKFGLYINIDYIKFENISYILSNHNKLYSCFNPSLFKLNDKVYYVFRVAVGGNMLNISRIINVLKHKFSYSRIIITDMKHIFHEVIIPKSYNIIFERGFEDPRSIIIGNYLYLVVSSRNSLYKKNQMFLIQIRTSDLNHTKNITPKRIIEITPSLIEIQSQKNWMPFLYDNKLHFVYNVNPHIIFECDINTGKCIEKYNKKYFNFTLNARGSSNIIEWYSIKYKKVYLGITHYRDGFIYTHRFYIFNNKFNILSMSTKFIIHNHKILLINNLTKKVFKYTKYLQLNTQFISGILYQNNEFHITYGQDDFCGIKIIMAEKELEKII